MILDPNKILNAKILIVDDQEANVRLLERVLGEAGYVHVSSTLAPQEVLELHRANDYDLILLDLQMPGMDGFEVMEGLKENKADSYLPVIVLTAQPAHKLRALEAGARDFVSKPFDLLEVKTRIRNMLEVRLLYRMLENYNETLERTVSERTVTLRESEHRFRRLTQLASDWYWEQNATGDFTQVSGPVNETLGLGLPAFLGEAGAGGADGWNEAQRKALQALIAERQPFLNFAISRVNSTGTEQNFRVNGEPIFNESGVFTGYRGIGAETGPDILARIAHIS